MVDSSNPIAYVIDALLTMLLYIITEGFIPMLQSLVPGSPNTIWTEAMYPLIIVAIIGFAVLIMVSKK